MFLTLPCVDQSIHHFVTSTSRLIAAVAVAYFQMYAGFNAQERTASHFSALAGECGWKVVEVYEVPGSLEGQYVAEPA